MTREPESMPATNAIRQTGVPDALPSAVGTARNFERDVVCLLGLPFDVTTMQAAVDQVRRCAFEGRRCFISTPNLNFAVAATKDPSFRDSVLHSDLSLVDGMPLVWIARLLGLPIRERVSGAGLFERIAAHEAPTVSVFFFGGPPGMAERACARLNDTATGARCVGFDSPGFGTLDDMSTEPTIQKINRSEASFVVVALGAQKGQAWIERNRARLNAPLICHLGAVVNFVAGSVERAPTLLQRLGLEWLWRIKEQPDLWRRYWSDGLRLLQWSCTRVLPHVALTRWRSLVNRRGAGTVVSVSHSGQLTTAKLRGDWTHDHLLPLRQVLTEAAMSGRSLCLDLAEVSWIDSAFVGLVLVARGVFTGDREFTLREPTRTVRRIFWFSGAEFLLTRPAPLAS
jgi:N-acetylglucosaminyldiphosphoundecaprenol N-acetyl-beta-D-mannosaminyltransferase